jgi:hypothetical protein
MTPSKPPMGINVASDTKAGLRFADMIVDGHKTLESRNSDTLRPYVGKRVAIVRTGEGKAKAIGEVTVGEPKVVNQRQFRAMEDEHKVPKGSRFDINTPTKHLYPMHDPVRYEEERDVGHGIVSRKVIHKAGGGSVEPTVDEMRQALANSGKLMPLAERDANLANFLLESQIKQRLYRGQRKVPKADKFVTTQDRSTPSFTEDPEVANVYSQQLGWDIAHGPGSTSVPVHVQMKKPFDVRRLGEHVTLDEIINQMDQDLSVPHHKNKLGYEDLADILSTLDHHVMKGGAKHNIDATDKRGHFRIRSFSQLADEISEAGSKKNVSRILEDLLPEASVDAYALADSHEMVKQLKKQGYDGMIHKDVFDAGMPYYKGDPNKIGEGFDAEHTIDAFRPFEQNKIKSAIGNRGTYDTSKPDITMAKGGSVVKEPKNTVKAYKLFRVHKDHPGKLFPLFVDANTPVEMNKWVDAKEGEMKGNKVKSKIGDLAYRPGWHAGDLPIATHIGEKSDPSKTAPDRRPANHAWAEVEMPNDVDWQSEATKRGTNAQGKLVPVKAHITDQIPKGGHYRYKTNPNMTGNWLIGGSMKVNKVLSDAEVERINKKAGMADLPRTEPFAKKTFGFAHGGMVNGCIAPDEFKAEEYVNYKSKGGDVKNTFDYEDADHVESVAKIASKHRDFNKIPDVVKHLSDALSQGSYKFIEDPRIQSAIKQAGHNGYYIAGKDGKQPIIRKAEGGAVLPIEQIKAQIMNRFKGLGQLQSIGANEAPSLGIKAYVPTAGSPDAGRMPVGGIDTSQGDLPVGGIDMSKQQPGHQLMPNPAGQQPGMDQVPANDQAPMDGMPPMGGEPPPQGASNILSMTPQGQAMAAMKPQGLAKGGSAKSVDEMKAELEAKKKTKVAPMANDDDDEEEEVKAPSKRILVKAEGAGGVTGIVIPHHMLHGRSWINKKGNKVVVPGLKDINKARAEVYGSENRDPLSIGQTGKIHKETLEDHFAKPLKDQLASEKEATARLRAAKHLGSKNNTLDESEKLDTVRHETDEEGRTHVGFASKGVAGHALYTSGHGKNEKHHIINTCPGQTEGCGGGKDSKGVIDTSRGTCFAPNAESQYVHAAVRRATHEQAKHDPKMTRDWILAHTGSMRDAANKADKSNQRLLFRPNVVDETDVSSRHVIRHLNEQRKVNDKPPIIANSYGKTNELHDPENGYHVTHSNVGPKVKKGQEISENIARDKARVRNTIMASDNKGDFKNEQGHKTPPKGSYMVTDVKRGSEMSKNMEKHITHAKYWTTGREQYELTPQEKEEGAEGHFGGNGKPSSEDEAHYGHKTIDGKRYDYQKQHILHPRLVNVPIRKKNKKTGEMETKDHMIPTDSRFKDTEFLPKNKFKTKNGKDAGHILMTTPTESTSNIGHETSFTHNVSPKHIEHAIENKGEYEIDKPEDQIKASNKEYRAPQSIKFYAGGGQVGGRHIGFSDDDFHAFPEQNVVAQRHLAMRGHDKEPITKHSLSDHKRKVTMNKDMDTMLLELTRNKKAK